MDTREVALKDAEQELAQLRRQIDTFPKELEKAVAAAEERAAKKTQEEAKMQAELTRKDHEREREISALRIANFESQLKRSDTALGMLEKQLAAASQKAQDLAVTVIESAKKNPTPGQQEQSPAQR